MQTARTFAPEISNLVAPAIIYNASSVNHVISVKVSDPQGVEDIADVNYEITEIGSTSPIAKGDLFDDGLHGDVIAKDGIFSNLIQGSFAQNDSGEFSLEVFARDKSGNDSDVLQWQIVVLSGTENSVPEVADVTVPNTVPIDSLFEFLITVRVFDSEGLSGIKRVSYQFFPPAYPNPTLEDTLADNGTLGDVTPGDGIYSTTLSSNLFRELTDYAIRVQAEDKSGNQSQATVVFIRGRFKFAQAPEITAVNVPRIANGNEVNQVLITADIADPEGLSDIDTVLFRLFLPDGQEAENSPQIMADDGNTAITGDITAGDGTFSSLLALPGGDDLNEIRDYTLVFQAQDKSNNLSEPVERRFVVVFSDAPYISDLAAPSSVQINPARDTKILITLDVRDPQGLSDIVLVQFRSFLPNGNEANNSPIQLFDNGNNDEGDEQAGDGIYSRFIFLPSQGVTPGDFQFVFEARDNSGLVSNIIEHILTVFP